MIFVSLKIFLEKFFRGYVVLEEADSPVNGKIQVRDELLWGKKLTVDGLSQSEGPVKEVWCEGLKTFKKTNKKDPKDVLILGLGAGTAARLILQFFPNSRILGIEIDPEMIRLGKKYFYLEESKNLEIMIKDAIHFDNSNYRTKAFDLILVDMYIGDKVPPAAESDDFLNSAKKLLTRDGMIIFNRLYYGFQKKKEAEQFENKLKKIFQQVEIKETWANKLFLCSG